jgi:hypothetical protein
MAKAKSRTAAAKAGSARAAEEPKAIGSEGSFQKYVAEAKALAAHQVVPMRADPNLAVHNVQVGLKALASHWSALEAALPELELGAIKKLEPLALGVVFAAGRVDRHLGTGKRIIKLLQRARELRDLMLTAADALAKVDLVPASAVKKIRKGKGPFDTADDLVQLAALFRKHADNLKGKSPVTKDAIKEAASLGTELLSLLKPQSAKRRQEMTPEVREAVDHRDRMWTLLVLRHRDMRRAGMWLWADDVDEHIPPLQSRVSKPKKKEEAAVDRSGPSR